MPKCGGGIVITKACLPGGHQQRARLAKTTRNVRKSQSPKAARRRGFSAILRRASHQRVTIFLHGSALCPYPDLCTVATVKTIDYSPALRKSPKQAVINFTQKMKSTSIVSLLCSFLNLTSAAAGVVNTTYYLSTTPPFGNGSSPSAPLDASSQAKLDAIWAQYMWQGSDTPSTSVTFIYAPGLYQTKGCNTDVGPNTIYSGNYHIGAGVDKTTIQLVGASHLTGDGIIFGVAAPHWVTGWGCSGMTLDCNAVNQPKWTGSGGTIGAIGCQGGDHLSIQNVKLIGWGTATVKYECFPIGIFSANMSNRSMNHILIDSCLFTSPATGNKDGVSCAGINDDAKNNVIADSTCVISNCQFIDCFSGTGFGYQHCYGAPSCINNFSINCDIGFFLEPVQSQFPGTTILVQGNVCLNTNRFAFILFHGSSAIDNITFQQNTTKLNANGIGICLTGEGIASPAANVNNVVARDNTLFSSAGNGNFGIYINENGTNDMRIQSVNVEGNYFYDFSSSPGSAIDLDPSSAVIVNSSVTNNYMQGSINY